MRAFEFAERQALQYEPEGMKVLVSVCFRGQRRRCSVPGCVMMPAVDEYNDNGAIRRGLACRANRGDCRLNL